jgi:hypothetical protein
MRIIHALMPIYLILGLVGHEPSIQPLSTEINRYSSKLTKWSVFQLTKTGNR